MNEQPFQRYEFTAMNGERRSLAYQKIIHLANKPDIIWLSGFNSDMSGSKVVALTEWAQQTGYGMVRFDYSGHGQSDGDFQNGTISTWLEDSRIIFAQFISRPCILVGSSMGGWLSLLMAKYLRDEAPEQFHNIAGMVMIAPAWDFTEDLMWARFNDAIRTELQTKGVYHRPSAYDDSSYPITYDLIKDGRQHLLANSTIPAQGPIRILQGIQDPDVPWQRAVTLVDMLESPDVVLHLIKDAEHRLSRPQDIARLLAAVKDVGDCIEQDARFKDRL